jgi:FOG: Transposase and inactivated derivatives
MFISFQSAVARTRRQGDLYFAALLDAQTISEAFGSARSLWQGWIYTPSVTVWVFLSQCLSGDHSCRDAVARLIAWRTSQGLKACSADTGAYCLARDAVPETACRELVQRAGGEVEQQAAAEWQWRGRRVRVVDGATITMADTPENQAEYPQQRSQRPGCGLPIARIVVIFSLSVGTVLDAAMGKYQGKQTGENSLFRTLHDSLTEGDVVLADRYFSGWFDIGLLRERGVDIVVRKHQLRATDFRTGRRLGKDDHVVPVPKPQRPRWMSVEEHTALPAVLELREVRVRVKQKGFRTKSLVVVTTLTDAESYPATDIADLYRRRWQGELHLRSLKAVMQMDHLRCKTPHRVRNEFFMHLLAYNLIRRMMAMAAGEVKIPPWQISFKGTLQTLSNFLPLLGTCLPLTAGCQTLIDCIASHIVGRRPDRYEPRRIKRRPKSHDLLMKARHEYQREAAK